MAKETPRSDTERGEESTNESPFARVQRIAQLARKEWTKAWRHNQIIAKRSVWLEQRISGRQDSRRISPEAMFRL